MNTEKKMHTETKDNLEELGMDLAVTASRFARTAASMADTPASSATWRALSTIKQLGPISISSLARLERTSLPTVTLITKRLEQNGYINRKPSPTDQRTTLVQISSTGIKQLEKWSKKLGETLQPQLEKLSAGELKTLAAAQKIMAKIVSEQQHKNSPPAAPQT